MECYSNVVMADMSVKVFRLFDGKTRTPVFMRKIFVFFCFPSFKVYYT